MYKYNIIRCPHCKTLQYVRVEQKTRKCIRCGRTLKLRNVAVLYRAKDGREASAVVRYLKAKEAGIADELYSLKNEE